MLSIGIQIICLIIIIVKAKEIYKLSKINHKILPQSLTRDIKTQIESDYIVIIITTVCMMIL
jgi:hypothetical protein